MRKTSSKTTAKKKGFSTQSPSYSYPWMMLLVITSNISIHTSEKDKVIKELGFLQMMLNLVIFQVYKKSLVFWWMDDIAFDCIHCMAVMLKGYKEIVIARGSIPNSTHDSWWIRFLMQISLLQLMLHWSYLVICNTY